MYILEGVRIQRYDDSSFNSDILHEEDNEKACKGSSLAWKLLRRSFVSPEEKIIHQVLEGFKESKTIHLKSKIFNSYIPPTIFLFWISTFAGIRTNRRMRTS